MERDRDGFICMKCFRQIDQWDPEYFEELDNLLRSSIEASISSTDKRIVVWASGGIDSSVLLYYLRDRDPLALHIYFKGEERELNLFNEITDYLNIETRICEMTIFDHWTLLDRALLNHTGPMTAFPTLPMFTALKSRPCDKILYALGLDECFAGYRNHVLAPDFKEVEDYHIDRLPLVKERHENQALALDMKIEAPFINDDLIAYCRGLPIEEKTEGHRTKIMLREFMRGKIPESNRLAGLIVGTKGGFHPPLDKWWIQGLRFYVHNHLSLFERIRTRGFLWKKIDLANEKHKRFLLSARELSIYGAR